MKIYGIHLTSLWLTQIFVSAFLAILFLQSGFDKVFDKKGNMEWLKGHFANSPLARTVPLLFLVITVLELCAGGLSAVGAIAIFLHKSSLIAYSGAVMAALAILSLFFGQRMAKDYAGAATLVPYFILTIAAIFILTPSFYRF